MNSHHHSDTSGRPPGDDPSQPADRAASQAAADQALRDLPHGPEFRFVDQVDWLDPGKAARGSCRVRGDEPFLAGHFPGRPMMPGVLMIEALAQLAGIAAQSDPATGPMDDLRLTAVRQCKILGSAGPGEVIALEVQITGRMGGLVQAAAIARVDGRPACKADLVLSGSPRPTDT